MSGRQLACRFCERLIGHHDRLSAAVLPRAGNDLLHGGDADVACQPLALDRHAGAAFPGNQVHAVVAGAGGVGDTPAPRTQLCRNEFLELDTRHLVDGRHFRRRAFEVTPALQSDSETVLPSRKPQQDKHRHDEAAETRQESGRHAASGLRSEIPRESEPEHQERPEHLLHEEKLADGYDNSAQARRVPGYAHRFGSASQSGVTPRKRYRCAATQR